MLSTGSSFGVRPRMLRLLSRSFHIFPAASACGACCRGQVQPGFGPRVGVGCWRFLQHKRARCNLTHPTLHGEGWRLWSTLGQRVPPPMNKYFLLDSALGCADARGRRSWQALPPALLHPISHSASLESPPKETTCTRAWKSPPSGEARLRQVGRKREGDQRWIFSQERILLLLFKKYQK